MSQRFFVVESASGTHSGPGYTLAMVLDNGHVKDPIAGFGFGEENAQLADRICELLNRFGLEDDTSELAQLLGPDDGGAA